MKTTTCILLLLGATAWSQQVAVPQGGSLGPSSRLSDAATLSADKVDGSHSSSTPAANAVPVTGSNGKLAPGWIPLPSASSIGGVFMDAHCLAGNHVSGIDPSSGRLECTADAAEWGAIGNKPAAFPPDINSQAWQDLLAALALKAPQAALDGKLASSALDSTLIVSKFNGGACSGYLKSDGSCDTPSGSEGTPSLDETSVSGAVYSAKPFKVAGTQTDMEVVEGTPVEVAGENHWSVDSATHRPAYSYNGGIANKVAFIGDSIAAENISGLGDAAAKNTGTAAGTLAAGDDSRITGALQASAFTSALVASKFANGSCSGYLKSDGTCSIAALSEDSAAVNSSKPVAVTGSWTDLKITEGTPTLAAGENHFFFNPETHKPSYSYNGGAAQDFALKGDMVMAEQLPVPTESTLGGVKSKTCDGTDKLSAIGSDGTPVCSPDQSGGGGEPSGWFSAPATTHTPGTENFSGSVEVTVGGCTGGTKYYSTDGGATVSAYSTPLTFTGTTTLVSRCEKDHYQASAALSSTYTVSGGGVGVLLFPDSNSNGAPRYFSVAGQNQGTESTAQIGSPIGGNVTAVYCNAAVAPVGGTDVVKLRINGTDAATCTIADGTHSASVDLSSAPVTLAKGDLVNAALTTFKTTSVFSLWARVENVTAGAAALPLFTMAGFNSGTTNYFSLGAKTTTGATGLAVGSPLGGTLAEMYVGSSVSTSTSEDITFKDVTGSTTPGACALASGTHAACTGLSGLLTKGNLINAGAANNSGSSATFGIYGRVEGAGAAVTALSFFNYVPIPASSTGYFSAGPESATQADVAMGSPVGGSVKEMYALVDNGVAAGTPDVITLYINGVPQDGLSGHGTMQCSITNPAVTCSYTSPSGVTINKGDLLSFGANNSVGSGAKFGVHVRVEGAN